MSFFLCIRPSVALSSRLKSRDRNAIQPKNFDFAEKSIYANPVVDLI